MDDVQKNALQNLVVAVIVGVIFSSVLNKDDKARGSQRGQMLASGALMYLAVYGMALPSDVMGQLQAAFSMS